MPFSSKVQKYFSTMVIVNMFWDKCKCSFSLAKKTCLLLYILDYFLFAFNQNKTTVSIAFERHAETPDKI